jgi:hypothetical protein
MPDAGLNTMRHVESVCEDPLGAGVPGKAVGVFIDYCYVADGVEAMHLVISATRELFSKDEGVKF